MLDCVSVETMRRSDRETIERGVSGLELISRAAQAVYEAVEWSGRIAILCGSGNNGADGYALSILLKNEGYDVTAFSVSARLHDDCAYYAAKAKEQGVTLAQYDSESHCLRNYDIIVDCMLGTGFQGEVKPVYRAAINEMNSTCAYVVSVDINSGMNGDSGAGECIVRSDVTVTIQFLKHGLLTDRAGEYIKRLICVPIGIALSAEEAKVCSDVEWENLGFGASDSCKVIDGIRYMKAPSWLILD